MTERVAFLKDPSEPKTVGVRHGVGFREDHFRAASENACALYAARSVAGDAGSASGNGICLYV